MLMAFFSIGYNEALRAYGTRPLHLVFSQNMRHQNIFFTFVFTKPPDCQSLWNKRKESIWDTKPLCC